MNKKTEATLRELLRRPEIKSDARVQQVLESLLDDIRNGNLVDSQTNVESLLGNRGRIFPDLRNLDHLRKLLRRIESRIEDLVDDLIRLLRRLRERRENMTRSDRRRLLRLLLALINLLNIRDLIERLLPRDNNND